MPKTGSRVLQSLEVGNLSAPSPTTLRVSTYPCHACSFADADGRFPYGSNFLNGRAVVQRPFEVALELRIDLNIQMQRFRTNFWHSNERR